MESSRRAVEAYWRSRMIDGATADEDKVSPVYKLEEICELLRSSHVNIVKEVSDYILKRLDHKSPIVKQKALRLIKYSMGKSGVEFKREMQRNSGVIRQLFHYKGQLDPLKGNALNKAVCDTAHEAISAIFASDDKPVPTEDINRRIQGFGNTNFEMPTEDKKSFLSEVVGLGSASIRQGLSSITAAHSLRKNDSGSYKSADLRPNLRRSLTTEIDSSDRFEREEHHRESFGSFGASKKDAGPWGLESRACTTETRNDDSVPNQTGRKSHEERLLETIVTSGGVRLQPTRDAIQAFLVEAAKLDALALSHALELKLQSPLWQVRMRAVCVLEAILRKKEASFATVASYFSESRDVIVNCSESPQASVREKANKVLGLLGGGQTIVGKTPAELSSVKSNTNAIVQLPDLIDTGDPDYFVSEGASQKNSDQSTTNLTASTLLVDDLFGDSLIVGVKSSGNKNIDDPFSDVSFHTTDALDRDHVDDLFSGLTVDEELNMPTIKSGSGLIDILSTNTEVQQEPIMHKNDLHELMAGLSVNETVPEHKQQGTFGGSFGANLVDSSGKKIHPMPNETLNGVMGGMNQNVLFPLGPLQYNFPANIMFNHAFASQPINYGVMGSLITQQQLLATMSNFQHLGNLANNVNVGFGNAGGGREEGYPLALPDTFHLLNNSIQSHSLMADSSKKGETRAFDFISDHLSAARDPKRDE